MYPSPFLPGHAPTSRIHTSKFPLSPRARGAPLPKAFSQGTTGSPHWAQHRQDEAETLYKVETAHWLLRKPAEVLGQKEGDPGPISTRCSSTQQGAPLLQSAPLTSSNCSRRLFSGWAGRSSQGEPETSRKKNALGSHITRCYLWHQQAPTGHLAAGDRQHEAPSSHAQALAQPQSRSPKPEGAVVVMSQGVEKQGHPTTGSRRTLRQPLCPDCPLRITSYICTDGPSLTMVGFFQAAGKHEGKQSFCTHTTILLLTFSTVLSKSL